MKKIITSILAALGLLSACGQQKFESVDVNTFASRLNAPDVVLVDVRSASEFAEGHIEGAVNIDQSQDDFVQQVQAVASDEKTVAVYCRSGRRSARAASLLANKGYSVTNLDGGVMAWQDAGKVLVK